MPSQKYLRPDRGRRTPRAGEDRQTSPTSSPRCFHATNAGKDVPGPDNPLLPNYKYVPVAYPQPALVGWCVSGTPVAPAASARQKGRPRRRRSTAPAANLDYELELGFYIGHAQPLGRAGLPMSEAGRARIFGFCLLNDWSARATSRAWEYSAARAVPGQETSPTTRVGPGWSPRRRSRPTALPAFWRGRPAIRRRCPILDAPAARPREGRARHPRSRFFLATEKNARGPARSRFRLSTGSFATIYWTVAQMVAHHAASGLQTWRLATLIGTGTCSGPQDDSRGCLPGDHPRAATQPITLAERRESRGFSWRTATRWLFRAHCGGDNPRGPHRPSANAAP